MPTQTPEDRKERSRHFTKLILEGIGGEPFDRRAVAKDLGIAPGTLNVKLAGFSFFTEHQLEVLSRVFGELKSGGKK